MQENVNILHFCWDTVLFFKSRETDYLLLKYKNIFFFRERHCNEAPIWGGVHFNKVNQQKFSNTFLNSLAISRNFFHPIFKTKRQVMQ